MDMKRRWWKSSDLDTGIVTFAQCRDGGINLQFDELDVWEEINQALWEKLSGRVTDENKDLEFFYVDEEELNNVAEKE